MATSALAWQMGNVLRVITHVKASCDACTLQRLLSGIFLPRCHQARHLILSQLNLPATKSRETDIGNLELGGWSTHCDLLGFTLSEEDEEEVKERN